MAQLLVRNVPDPLVAELKRRAARSGRSAEAEHRKLLQDVLGPVEDSAWWDEARELRARLGGRIVGDSTDLIREDRRSR